jgi:hypothetical protein
MNKFLCRLLDHDRMTTGTRHRICVRCGTRETLRQFGSTSAWEEDAKVAIRGAGGAKGGTVRASR